MRNFEKIRIHRSVAASLGALAATGFDIVTAVLIGASWMIAEIINFVLFTVDETN